MEMFNLPLLPASCSWIFSNSIGVVTIIWHKPAPAPDKSSRWNGSLGLKENNKKRIQQMGELTKVLNFLYFIIIIDFNIPFLSNICIKLVCYFVWLAKGAYSPLPTHPPGHKNENKREKKNEKRCLLKVSFESINTFSWNLDSYYYYYHSLLTAPSPTI